MLLVHLIVFDKQQHNPANYNYYLSKLITFFNVKPNFEPFNIHLKLIQI